MRQSALILLVAVVAGCEATHATDKTVQATDKASQTPDKSNEAQKWQGTWKLVSATSSGQTETADCQWIVAGDHYNIRLNGQIHSDPYTFKLDPSHRRIDVFHHETPKGTWGGSFKGIYELKGDYLKVCYDGKGHRYPTSFDASPGTGQILYQLQRERH